MEENNNNQNTPSTSSDVMPSGGSNIGQAATQGAKKAAKKGWNSIKEGVGRGLKALWALLPMTVKIVVIVVLIILIIIAALLMMGMISEGTNVASGTVDDYIAGATDLDDEAKSLFDEKSSLIKLKLSDINKVYDKFVNDDKGGAETQTLMQYKIGTNDVAQDKETKRIVNVDDKLPLYKHILLTEKYNFNDINWYKYSHSTALNAKKVDKFKEDKELGIKYPDDSKNEAGGNNPNPTKLEKFIDLTLPYLQTWYIPLSMSNASIISGTEEDSSRAPAFSYNIIKEAYSNIIVNWYELKKHTTVTQYHTYDKVKKHDVIYNVEVVERVYDDDSKSYSLRTSAASHATFEDSRIPHNTSTNNGLASGTKNPMKENLIRQSDEYTSHYYIKQADVFDAKIINEFNYQVYSDSDASKRINADHSSETTATYTKAAENLENMYNYAINGVGCDDNGNLYVNGAQYSVTSQGSYTEDDPTNSTKEVNVYKYDITLGSYYDYENGLEHQVTRVWKDKLSQTSSETSGYSIDDLIKYNQSSDRKVKVQGNELCGDSYNSSSGSGQNGVVATAATQIKIGSKTYPVYNQNSYPYTTSHGGQTVAVAGCGLCSITTVIGGITGQTVDPISIGNNTSWTGPKYIADYANDLISKYNINCTYRAWGAGKPNQTTSNDDASNKKSISRGEIESHLNSGNPVIIQVKGNWPDLGTTSAHYIVLCGIENGKVIMANSAGGYRGEATLDYILNAMYDEAETDNGYILVNTGANSTNNAINNSTNNSSSNNDMSNKMQEMINFAVSLKGSLPYGAPPYIPDTKEKLKTISQIDCSGFVSSLYNIFFGVNIGKYGIADLIPTASKVNEKGLKGQSFTYDQTKGESQLQVGDVLHSPGHVVMYIGNYDGKPSIISQGTDGDPSIYALSEYGATFDSYARYINNVNISGSTGSSTGISSVCNSESGKYYTQLSKTDGLNRIDFMNSNPDIFHRYIRDGAEYYKYVGYSRSKLSLSYWNLKKLFNSVIAKNDGIVPWAYGNTLGFDNVYNSNKESTNNIAGGGRFIWPIPEYVEAGLGLYEQLTSTFGTRTNPITGAAGQNHSGIDISAGVNTSANIVAAASGTVMKASDSGDGYGVCVVIQHSDGYYTLYGHMATGSLKVKVGDTVNSGQQIGVMGTTGNSTGNHLHFEVIKFDGEFSMAKIYGPGHVNCLDPVDFFNEDCSPIGGGAGGTNLIEYIHTWEYAGKPPTNSDGTKYQIYTGPEGNRVIGYGLDLDAGGYASVLQKAGYPTSVGSYVDKEFIDSLEIKSRETFINEVKSRVSGLNLKEYQIDALVSRAYNCGTAGALDYGRGSSNLNFVESYNRYWNESKDNLKGQSEPNFNHPLYINYMSKPVTADGVYMAGLERRRKSEWRLFQTGKYEIVD